MVSAQSRDVVSWETQAQATDRPEHRAEGGEQFHEPADSTLQNAGAGTEMEAEGGNGPAKAWLDAAPPLYCADASGNLVFRNHAFDEIAPALFGDDGVADTTRQSTAAPSASDRAPVLESCVILCT